ncbi:MULTISPECIES: hypothetical protein [unclassified Sphingobium]|jgi:hypothetical protein|nr:MULTISPECIES: hypothetical protein [unclassified Sphingobium]WIW89809.1 hypothetical protein K3M67_07650 [Sphingobium sp. V4]
MNQWDFVIAAYAVTAIGTAIVTMLSWRAMCRAERAVESFAERP